MNRDTFRTALASALLAAFCGCAAADGPEDSAGESETSATSMALAESAACRDPVTRLTTFWSETRTDNATLEDERQPPEYTRLRIEGGIFNFPMPRGVPLNLYWSAARSDNMLATSGPSEQQALAANYVFVRTVGYVYPTRVSGTAPLRWFWHAGRQDNYATATIAGIQAATAAGYQDLGPIGYVFEDPWPLKFLSTVWSGARQDNLTTNMASGVYAEAKSAGYVDVDDGRDVLVSRYLLPGTTPIANFWSAARADHVLVRESHYDEVRAAGYSKIEVEGYAFTAPNSATTPFDRFWSSARSENFTTVGAVTGYVNASNEGHVFHPCGT